jgi:anaerobic selenocysteine-containing dehydrogenase
MGYGEHFSWANEEETIAYQLEPLGITIQDLDDGDGLYYGSPVAYRKYERDGFNTPTGKVEFYSHVLNAYGYDPLPDYAEPAESPINTPKLARKYPLVLNGGFRVPVYTHSRHRNLPSLRTEAPHPLAEMHPDTAAPLGVHDGDWIAVETLRGSVTIRARVTDEIRPGIVGMLHGWAEANANLLTDHANCDSILASPPLRSGLCRVTEPGAKP